MDLAACCYISEEGDGCERVAEYGVRQEGSAPESVFYACEEHLHALIPDNSVVVIWTPQDLA
jgi:hypothetical protein